MAEKTQDSKTFTNLLGIELPIICGAMYPCSNPELVAAVSEAGGMGIVQPLSLTYVYGYDFREGLRYIRSLTQKPIGVNLIIEQSSQRYSDRVRSWLDIALDENVEFFVTALGKPDWVVNKTNPAGATVFHDVTNNHWAEKALDCGVDGFICVNNRAGGHAGQLSQEQLFEDLSTFQKPLVCAGGIGSPETFNQALQMGYAGVQMGTRFIASTECVAHTDYKQAIIEAQEDDIVLTERITGISVSVIETPYIKRVGTKAGPIAKWLLKGKKTKHWMRMIYSLQSIWLLKKASLKGMNYKDYFQAGKSVEGIHAVKSVTEIIAEYSSVLSRS